MREVDRVEVIREVLGRRLRQGEASERLGICVCAAGEAAGAAVPGRRGEGAEIEVAGETGEQCDSAGVEEGDRWGGAGALRGLCTDPGVGEVAEVSCPSSSPTTTNASRWPQKPPRTPTATCSMTRPPSTSSSPSIPPESSAAISPAVTAAASTRSKAKAAATASVAPPSPSVRASTAPSPSCAKARPSTTESSLKASRPSPQTTKKASAVPSTRPAPSSANAPATNPPQTTPGTAGLASIQPLPLLPHSHPRLVPL